MPPYDTIATYHQATKHHLKRYARSAGYMDWPNQPNPFRCYDGAEQVSLPFASMAPDLAYGAIYSPTKEQGAPLNISNVGAFCEHALGLSAWKQAGANRWSLRINPSSGNLHPTEGYLLLPNLPTLDGGVFHYAPFAHALERRARLPEACWKPMQKHFGPGFGVVLTAIFWREAWKYGERAYRYCNLDTGHALAALTFAARLYNWQCCAITSASDDQLSSLLGITHTDGWPFEREEPEVLCWVSTGALKALLSHSLPDSLVRPLRDISFSGRPNRLSPLAGDWPIIERAADATRKPVTPSTATKWPHTPVARMQPMDRTAAGVIRQRRSAISYDPGRSISEETFLSILAPTLARTGIPPFGVELMAPAAHMVLFVHRVKELAPGLYLLARGADDVKTLSALWRSDFQWQPVAADLPLYRLLQMDMTDAAMELSCHQQIAGQSAFAVAMLAPFESHLQPAPYLYRHLHWECGMIGQVLYLGAEAHGLRATGIGCFFDDEVHRLMGIKDNSFQSLYHFTVGNPIEDDRLTTLPAYHHIKR